MNNKKRNYLKQKSVLLTERKKKWKFANKCKLENVCKNHNLKKPYFDISVLLNNPGFFFVIKV